jgi:hypothetical protein
MSDVNLERMSRKPENNTSGIVNIIKLLNYAETINYHYFLIILYLYYK